MKNKTKYQQTFARLTASEDTIQEVLQMKENKKYRHIKKSTALIAAAMLLMGTTGVAYAATGGDLTKLWEKITLIVDGETADVNAYLETDESGNSHLAFEGKSGSMAITLAPDVDMDLMDLTLNIDTSLLDAAPGEQAYPFSVLAENERLYLIPDSTEAKVDITTEAASSKGYAYTWTNADGTETTAIVLGTPEGHCVSFG